MAEYIEREALIKRMCEGCGDTISERCNLEDCSCVTVDMVMRAPAADVVEVVHGRWIVTKEHNDIIDMDVVKYTCSACKKYRLSAVGLNQATNYCPNCGAKMKGE